MTLKSQEALVPARVYVHLAPVGTAAPVDVDTPLVAAYKNCGHTTPDSLAFNTEPQFQEIPSHQSDYPIRREKTSDSASVSVDLLQWNADNFVAAYGGGAVTETSTGSKVYKFTPPAMSGNTEKTAVVEIVDGTKKYRFVYPRVMQIEGVQTQFQKGQGSVLPLRLAVLGDDGVDPWYVLTNDPSFKPAAA
ncbi:MAG TPA: hypothetical protein VGF17_12690 [Phytomonospora sp.]